MLKTYYASSDIGVKHAEELIKTNKFSEACLVLLDTIISKKTRTVVVSQIEPIALKFVQLCIDTNNNRLAKDGLVHYRNIIQNHDTSSIKTVFEEYINYSEDKTIKTLESSNETMFDKVEDLDSNDTPNKILSNAFIKENKNKEDAKFYIILALKQEWETYRNLLDIAKNNTRLESIYQFVCTKAFMFCEKYNRKLEFRRLCELLRNHLGNFNKTMDKNFSVDLNDPESMQKQLLMRFEQLRTAINLELWNEAAKSIEDIYTLFMMSDTDADPSLVAEYYKSLIKVLYTCKNYVFHAASWMQLYKLVKQNEPKIKIQMQSVIDSLIISVLIIPINLNENELNRTNDENSYKLNRVKELVGVEQTPTRASLLKEVIKEGIVKEATHMYNTLFNALEVDVFNLKTTRETIQSSLLDISKSNQNSYLQQIKEAARTKLMLHIPEIYSNISLSSLLSILRLSDDTADFDLEDFEDYVMAQRMYFIKINHKTQSVEFDRKPFLEKMNKYLCMGSATYQASSYSHYNHLISHLNVKSTYFESLDAKFKETNDKTYQENFSKLREEHKELIERKHYIEIKKETAEWFFNEKEKKRINEVNQRMQKENELQKKKLAEQNKEREQKEIERQFEKIKRKEALNYASKINHKITEEDAKDISTEKLKELQKEQEIKEHEYKINQTNESIRKIDYTVRAYRREEIPLLEKYKEEQAQNDKKTYDEMISSKKKKHMLKHEKNLKMKERISEVNEYLRSIKQKIINARETEFNKLKTEKERIFNQKKDEIICEYRKLYKEKQEALKKKEKEREAEMLKEQELKNIERKRLSELEKTAKIQKEKELEAERRIEMEKQRIKSASQKFVARKTVSNAPPSYNSAESHRSSTPIVSSNNNVWRANKTPSTQPAMFKDIISSTTNSQPAKITPDVSSATKQVFKANKSGSGNAAQPPKPTATSSASRLFKPSRVVTKNNKEVQTDKDGFTIVSRKQ